MEEPKPYPTTLAPCGSGRRSCGDSVSPEFEFWMVRNPSFPQPNLVSADEIFSDGVLLPLHHLNLSSEPPTPQPESAELSATSKRWRDIFRKNDKKSSLLNGDKDNTVKERRRREKKNGVGGSATSAELNINIWPFVRSRSAGNGGTRPRATATRKVSSAPCSRSNSRGASKSKKLPSSPGRGGGVHLGRSSPVWHVRRSAAVAGGSKAKVLSLHVPMCMGYRQQFSCSSSSRHGANNNNSNLFNIRTLFTKKLY